MRSRSASPNQVLALVCVGIVLANLDLFIVNVALPDIARTFPGTSLEDLSWILNGDAIAYAALLVCFGRLTERHHCDNSFHAGSWTLMALALAVICLACPTAVMALEAARALAV